MKISQINSNVYSYLINCIDTEGYGKELNTNTEKLQFIADTFKSEYGYNIKRLGLQETLKEWFMGLPSSFNIDFTYHDIIERAKELGSLPENATETQENKIIANWFNYMAYKLIQLLRKNNIEIV